METSPGHTSSMVWLILFSLLVILSVISNTAYLISSLLRRQFSLPRLVLATFFLLNLLDYALLAFEFSLGGEDHQHHQFPYSESWCGAYQALQQTSPLLTAAAVVLFSRLTISDSQPVRSNTTRIIISLALAALLTLLILPSIFFSEIAVYPSTASYCVIDLSGLANKVGLDC